MNKEFLALIISAGTGLFFLLLTIVLGVIGYMFKKSVFETLEIIEKTLKFLTENQNTFEKSVLKDYATKEDITRIDGENHRSHVEIWKEIKRIDKSLAVLENKNQG